MKRISNILSSFLFSLAFIGTLGSATLFAQTQAEKELADFIKLRTNRTFAGLKERRGPNGTISVALEDRFQNIMLARLGYSGNPVAACVTELQEANLFFGKDLESGRLLSGYQTPFDDLGNEAARHGMSVEELLFYKNLISEAAARLALNPGAATITIVNNDGSNEGFNDPTMVAPEGGNTATTRGAQRLNVFNAAAAIWGTFLDSPVNIQVRSQFNPQTCTATSAVLGSASTVTVHRDFPNAQSSGTWYHQALANKLAGVDLSTDQPDINATFNSNLNGDPNCLGGGRFYLGLDNSTPAGTLNLLVVLLHEMGHGLGFSNFANGTTGALFQGFPDVYTAKMYDRSLGKYWNEMTNAERISSAVNANNVLWDGANVKIASDFMFGGRETATGRVELYTPAAFSSGSSLSHWNTTASPNLLMEPFINVGLSLNLDLTPHQLRDVGWFRDTNLDIVPDAVTNVTPSGGFLVVNSPATVTWNNEGGFNKNVTIELSTDGGATYPTVIASNIANTGSFTFTVPNLPTTQGKIRVREFNFAQPAGESAATFSIQTTAPVSNQTFFDFDGDNKTDVSIFRPSAGEWWYLRSSDGAVPAVQFGQSTDEIAPADYTGDGKTDIAFFRPSDGFWYVLRSEDFSFYAFPFGSGGDIPVPADFDGDGKADPTVFRPSNAVWYTQRSSDGQITFQAFGSTGDVPLPNDFDGDGKADLAVFKTGPSEWWIQRSSNSTVSAVQFGSAGDRPTPADLTGDGKTDIAFFRPSTGFWFVLRSEDASFYAFPFGSSGDVPVTGDYDGDGRADAAVFRPSNATWYLQQTSSGFTAVGFGAATDQPVPSAYLP
jgi:hypothetical protein